MFPGIADRMNKEITARAPTSMKVKVGTSVLHVSPCCRKQEKPNSCSVSRLDMSDYSLGPQHSFVLGQFSSEKADNSWQCICCCSPCSGVLSLPGQSIAPVQPAVVEGKEVRW